MTLLMMMVVVVMSESIRDLVVWQCSVMFQRSKVELLVVYTRTAKAIVVASA